MIKFLQFCFFEIKAQIKGNKVVFITIILTISITLAAVLVLINILSVSVSSVEELNTQKCIYSPKICVDLPWGEMKTEINRLSDIVASSKLPEVIQYELSLNVNSDSSDIKIADDQYVRIGLNILPDSDIWLAQDMFDSVEQEIIFGQIPYTDGNEEFPSLLLGKDTLDEYFKNSDVGGIVEIGDRQYQISAILSSDKNYILGAQLDDNCETQLMLQTLIFFEPLTTSQREYFNDCLSGYEGTNNKNLYETRLLGEIITYVTYCVVVIMLIFFCMATIMRLFRYVFTDRLYVYNIYKIHGIKQSCLAAVLAIDIMIMTALSATAGIGLFILSKPIQQYFYIYWDMPISIIAIVIAALLLLTILIAFPTINKLAKRPPLDRTFWR